MTQTVHSILARKGTWVDTIDPDRTIREAASQMKVSNVGALPVVDGESLLGIISERDILNCVSENFDLDAVTVRTSMSDEVLIVTEDENVDVVMDLMTKQHVRHLPVIRSDRIVGIISIGDVVNALRDEDRQEIRLLNDYIYGPSAPSAASTNRAKTAAGKRTDSAA